MGSLSGAIQRPLVAAFAVAVASVSTELSDTLFPSPTTKNKIRHNKPQTTTNHHYHHSLFTLIRKIPLPPPPPPRVTLSLSQSQSPNSLASSVASSEILRGLFDSARSSVNAGSGLSQLLPGGEGDVAEEGVYRWHLAEGDVAGERRGTVVVLLGWLGAKQRHLKRYAEWYTSRGFHVITFTFPISEIVGFGLVGGDGAEEKLASLVDHLADCLEEEGNDRNALVFHTFSNTGWLTYGAILERFQKQDKSLMGKIKGCIVDSAPVAAPDPQVWASGFSAAFLKKHSIATKGVIISSNESRDKPWNSNDEVVEQIKPAMTETALLLVLEKFFGVVLNLPTVNRRLCDVLRLLNTEQPSCPQLYIYSSADRVIPSDSVESFIEKQKKSGREVRACNFVSTPHVDHFRNDPELYSTQLTHFLEDCVLTSCNKTPLVDQPVETIKS